MLNLLYSCVNDVESTEHFPIHLFSPEYLRYFNYSLLENTSPSDNSKILNVTIDFILPTKRFDE